MAHPRKKGRVRKDHKVARMREDVEERKANAAEPTPESDQHDVVPYKMGSQRDRGQDPSAERRRA
mgnify:CR=1 FL=1